jgi:hypothetical protein
MLMTFFHGNEVYVSFMPEGVKLPFRTLAEATSENPIVLEIKFGNPSPTDTK